MRRSARTDLCGGRSVMIVPTASVRNRRTVNQLICQSLQVLTFRLPSYPPHPVNFHGSCDIYGELAAAAAMSGASCLACCSS
jgi:hypothetical protein